MSSIVFAVIGTAFILMAVSVDKYRNNPSGWKFRALLLGGVGFIGVGWSIWLWDENYGDDNEKKT